jgi:hypothetical protein
MALTASAGLAASSLLRKPQSGHCSRNACGAGRVQRGDTVGQCTCRCACMCCCKQGAPQVTRRMNPPLMSTPPCAAALHKPAHLAEAERVVAVNCVQVHGADLRARPDVVSTRGTTGGRSSASRRARAGSRGGGGGACSWRGTSECGRCRRLCPRLCLDWAAALAREEGIRRGQLELQH